MKSDLEELIAMRKAKEKEKLTCAYDTSRGFYRHDGMGCCKGKVTRQVTVIYNEVERDTLYLCEDCYRGLLRSVRKYGYKLTSTKL